MRYYVLLILFALPACNKESAAPITITEALTSSRWQLGKIEVAKPPGTTPGDVTLTHYKICELDDIIEFKASGVYDCSENIDICFPANNSPFYKVAGGNWNFNNSDSVVTMYKGTDQVVMTIRSASLDKIDMRQRHFNLQMEEMEYIFTLVPVK